MTQRRIYQCAFPYHITFNVLNREWFFGDETKTKLLYEIILNAGDIKNHKIYQFCIMPNHVHLLCKTENPHPMRGLENPRCGDDGCTHVFRSEGFPTCDVKNTYKYNISDFIKSIKGTFSRKIHTGNFWQERFHDKIIQTDKQLYAVIDYIAHKPIKAGLPEKWNDYPYQYINDELINELFF